MESERDIFSENGGMASWMLALPLQIFRRGVMAYQFFDSYLCYLIYLSNIVASVYWTIYFRYLPSKY